MKCHCCKKPHKSRSQNPGLCWEHGYCSSCWGHKLLFVDEVDLSGIRLDMNPVDAYWHRGTLKEMMK